MIRVDLVNMISVDRIRRIQGMRDELPAERLRAARKNAGFRSARAAAIRHNWTPSTYAAHENGQNGFSVEDAQAYGRAFKISSAWLLSGEGDTGLANTVRVVGMVSAGGLIATNAEDVGHDGLGEIEVPFPLPPDAAAYQVTGDSMFPRYDDGDVIIVRTRASTIDDVMNFESMVTTADGDRYLKRVVEGSKKGFYDLESFNAPVMRNVKIRAVAMIHSVVRRGQWRRLDVAGKRRKIRTLLTRDES